MVNLRNTACYLSWRVGQSSFYFIFPTAAVKRVARARQRSLSRNTDGRRQIANWWIGMVMVL
jgi:hypothetical protein